MTEIRENDRIEMARNGRKGTVLRKVMRPALNIPVLWDESDETEWVPTEAWRDGSIKTIGHRYFVDTPFTIGETYNSDGLGGHKVVGVGLAVENFVSGLVGLRNPDGTTPNGYEIGNLILPANKRTVTLELTDEQLEQVKKVLGD